MDSKSTNVINQILSRDLNVYTNLNYLAQMLLAYKDEDDMDPDYLVERSKLLRDRCLANVHGDTRLMEIWWQSLYLLSRYDFDSYLLYMERERPAQNRFYLPRREQLIKIGAVQLLQDLEDDKIDVGALSVVPGAGKTTLEEFFITWVIGRHVDDYNIFASHSGGI